MQPTANPKERGENKQKCIYELWCFVLVGHSMTGSLSGRFCGRGLHTCALVYSQHSVRQNRIYWKHKEIIFKPEREDICPPYCESFVSWESSSAFTLLSTTSNITILSQCFHFHCLLLITHLTILRCEHLSFYLPCTCSGKYDASGGKWDVLTESCCPLSLACVYEHHKSLTSDKVFFQHLCGCVTVSVLLQQLLGACFTGAYLQLCWVGGFIEFSGDKDDLML